MKKVWTLGLLALGLVSFGVSESALAQAPKPPFAGGAAAEEKDPKLDKMKSEVEKLEADFKAKPKDEKLKAKLIESTFKMGKYMEYDSKLSPRNRYRGALTAYRRVLVLDPKHKDAKKEKEQIEKIYKQMGMPVPQ